MLVLAPPCTHPGNIEHGLTDWNGTGNVARFACYQVKYLLLIHHYSIVHSGTLHYSAVHISPLHSSQYSPIHWTLLTYSVSLNVETEVLLCTLWYNEIPVEDHLTNYWHIWIFSSSGPQLFVLPISRKSICFFFYSVSLSLIILVECLWEHKLKLLVTSIIVSFI